MPELIVYKGKSSQTGVSFCNEFPYVEVDESSLSFPQIEEKVSNDSIQAVLPIWNSHFGEINLSNALGMIFNEVARLYYLWPEMIIFECLSREPLNKKLTSIKVVNQQCSRFMNKHGFILDPKEGVASTVDAYEIFKKDDSFSAVLCAPGANKDDFNVLSEDASNPINFTTFALLASPCSESWDNPEWGGLSEKIIPARKNYTAIEMSFSLPFSDSQEQLFDLFIDEAESIDDVPKVLFVSEYKGKNCRILIESQGEFASPEMLSDDGADDGISIIPNVGYSAEGYSGRANKFLHDRFDLEENDFIRHVGKDSYFFSCPALGIVTHGFNSQVTENIVRQLIKRCFELLNRGTKATDAQRQLYEKYLDDYMDKGLNFINFVDVGFES